MYKFSIFKIRKDLTTIWPDLEATESGNPPTDLATDVARYDLACHILWMTTQMENFKEADKAGRWIGYAYRAMQELGLWSFDDVKSAARHDAMDNRNNILVSMTSEEAEEFMEFMSQKQDPLVSI